MNRLVALALAAILATSCGSSSAPTSPSTSAAQFVVIFVSTGTYTATFNSVTYTNLSSNQSPVVSLNPGTYDISGTFSGVAMGIAIAQMTSGSVGSLKSLTGPSPGVSAVPAGGCEMLYFPPSSVANAAFHLQFTIFTASTSTC